MYVGIYCNNHRHLLQLVEKTDGRVLWTNNLLLFGLSLVPVALYLTVAVFWFVPDRRVEKRLAKGSD